MHGDEILRATQPRASRLHVHLDRPLGRHHAGDLPIFAIQKLRRVLQRHRLRLFIAERHCPKIDVARRHRDVGLRDGFELQHRRRNEPWTKGYLHGLRVGSGELIRVHRHGELRRLVGLNHLLWGIGRQTAARTTHIDDLQRGVVNICDRVSLLADRPFRNGAEIFDKHLRRGRRGILCDVV